jgi:hypothetical protein
MIEIPQKSWFAEQRTGRKQSNSTRIMIPMSFSRRAPARECLWYCFFIPKCMHENLMITQLASMQSLISLLLIRKIIDTHVLPPVSVLPASIMCPSLTLPRSELIQYANDGRALWQRRPERPEPCAAAETGLQERRWQIRGRCVGKKFGRSADIGFGRTLGN